MTTPSIGTLGVIAFDTALPFDTSSIPLEIILPESLNETAEIIQTDGMTGTVEQNKERTREGIKAYQRLAQIGLLTYHAGYFAPLHLRYS